MSIDPNHDLNPIFTDDQDDAFSSPENDDVVPGSDLGNPDMRDVVRRESPGLPPAGAADQVADQVVDDHGVDLPNAERADIIGGGSPDDEVRR